MNRGYLFAIAAIAVLFVVCGFAVLFTNRTEFWSARCSSYCAAFSRNHLLVDRMTKAPTESISSPTTTSSSTTAATTSTTQNHKVEKRVVSFGLYGTDARYTTGAIRNTEMYKLIMPDWICRFYVDDSVPVETIERLKKLGAEIVVNNNVKGGIAGMFWRFLVADDETVDRYIVRDADSRPTIREKMAIDEWIESGKGFHIIRDHINHNYNMNGGLWGGTKGGLGAKMSDLINQWHNKDSYIADMEFLGSVVWSRIHNNQIAHDSYNCERYPNTRPFPTKRYNMEIVGAVYDKDDISREGDWKMLVGKHVPEKCRAQPDWIYG